MLLISRVMLFCYSLFIITFSLMNFEQVTEIVNAWDKVAHAASYCLFAMLSATSSQNRLQYTGLLFAGFTLGLSVEYMQGLTSYRVASIEDVYANAAGLFTGMTLNLIMQQLGYHFFNKKKVSQ